MKLLALMISYFQYFDFVRFVNAVLIVDWLRKPQISDYDIITVATAVVLKVCRTF